MIIIYSNYFQDNNKIIVSLIIYKIDKQFTSSTKCVKDNK